MTNERAIQILEDYLTWINENEPLHWSAFKIALAMHVANLKIEDDFVVAVLNKYREWLEFGQPFYHSIQQLKDCLSIAIKTLKNNQ